MKFYLKLLAPYLAIVPIWLLLENAWLTILAYHAQILIWSHRDVKKAMAGWNRDLFLKFSAPCLATVAIGFYLIPIMTGDIDLDTWLRRYGLEGYSFILMIPYFGLVHPVLEQTHWYSLRKDSRLSHLCFAGYHAIVLYTLLSPAWLIFCVTVLVLVSSLWRYIDKKTADGFIVPVSGHIFADTGIILAAFTLI